MSTRQKDTIKDLPHVITVDKPKRVYHENEPIRYKVKKLRLIDIGDDLKRIYRIKN